LYRFSSMVRCYAIGVRRDPLFRSRFAFSVTPPGYGVPMIEIAPTPNMTDEQVEAWFATAGLNVTVVEHCPAMECSLCTGASTPIAA